jgi:hypothetical protein
MGAQQAFLYLAFHAKMHKRLDGLMQHRQDTIQRLERAEIKAYDNEAEYQKLEAMKKELLGIKFV